MELGSTNASLGPVEMKIDYRRTDIPSADADRVSIARLLREMEDRLLLSIAREGTRCRDDARSEFAILSNRVTFQFDVVRSEADRHYDILSAQQALLEARIEELREATLFGRLRSLWQRWTS